MSLTCKHCEESIERTDILTNWNQKLWGSSDDPIRLWCDVLTVDPLTVHEPRLQPTPNEVQELRELLDLTC